MYTTISMTVLAIFLLVPSPSFAQLSKVKAPTGNVNYVQHTFNAKDGSKINYWFMSPTTIEEGTKYPLVLTLHGGGGNTEAATVLGSDTLRKEFPCFVMAPAVTSSTSNWASPRGYNKKNRKEMLPVVLEAVDTLMKKYPIAADRIYVTGQSMGAVGTFGAISLRPDFFAAAIPVAGGWDPEDAIKMKHIAIWVFHGDQDKTVNVDYSRNMVDAIKKAGGTPKYTEYKGVGHNSWTKTYESAEVWKWLFAQRHKH